MSFLFTTGKYLYNKVCERKNYLNKYSLFTCVSGYDNKNTHYPCQLKNKWKYGDDACFVAENDENCIIGVADGVGAWRRYGIDPGIFARCFMYQCEMVVFYNKTQKLDDPLWIASEAMNSMLDSKTPVPGSCTTCLLSLSRSSGTLNAANIGDCGYIVLRHDSIVYKSSNQRHFFNTPYQISIAPSSLKNVTLPSSLITEAPTFHSDQTSAAHVSRMDVEAGDVVVAGSDGLFDNISADLIASEVVHARRRCSLHSLFENRRHSKSKPSWMEKCAERLVTLAREKSKDFATLTPFASDAKNYGISCQGGNPGDITVILGLVVEEILAAPA